jgi:hypothetical protein
MPDYGEINSKTWKRANRIVIDNVLGQMPTSNYSVEVATRNSETDELISKQQSREFTINHNLEDSFQLRNPMTGESLGATMTKQELFIAIFSCGWHDMEVNGV